MAQTLEKMDSGRFKGGGRFKGAGRLIEVKTIEKTSSGL